MICTEMLKRILKRFVLTPKISLQTFKLNCDKLLAILFYENNLLSSLLNTKILSIIKD